MHIELSIWALMEVFGAFAAVDVAALVHVDIDWDVRFAVDDVFFLFSIMSIFRLYPGYFRNPQSKLGANIESEKFILFLVTLSGVVGKSMIQPRNKHQTPPKSIELTVDCRCRVPRMRYVTVEDSP